jgi:hypothetical protein
VERLIDYWFFYVPDSLLLMLIAATIARIFFSAFLGPLSKNPLAITANFISQPAVSAVNFISPRALPMLAVLGFTLVWLFTIRVLLSLGLSLAGKIPMGL